MISLRSEITRKLLNYFFVNPRESLYVNELERKLGVDKRNLVKKLLELERTGILKSQKRGNLKLYLINRDYPLYNEFKNIFFKTAGVESTLRKIMEDAKGVARAYIYGSFARDKMDAHSDVDLLVIGEHDTVLLQKKLNKFQREIDREINAVSMDEAEFNKRKKTRDPFVAGIFRKKHIRLK